MRRLFLPVAKSTMGQNAFLEMEMFSGSIVALVTPMDSSGEVDYASLKNLVDFHVNAGTDAIVSVGTTGESATVTVEEHIKIVLKRWNLLMGVSR